jgi:two-component system, chemotaxis family, response regulator Rcp1
MKAIDILLVEDSPSDVLMTREALQSTELVNRLWVVQDGVEALAYLRRQEKFVKATRPDLILLDLNLPRKDGREVLAEIKADQDLKSIPVVVLTTSRSDEDILKAYGLHANCYIAKPVDFQSFFNIMQSLENFWCKVVSLPRK